MKINIFGSCYTRELFNYQDKYDVGCYVMQQSIFTLYAKPLAINLEQARSVEGTNFKNRMVYYEFNKLSLKKVLESPSDYLIIDFADARYDIYNFTNPEGVKIIYNHDSRATFDNIKDDDVYKNIEKEYYNVEQNYSDEQIKQILTRFLNDILKVYKPTQIILNRIQMTEYYYISGKKESFKENFHYTKLDFIKKVEDIFLSICPECKILITDDEPVANINHRFGGPHPMHFEDIYYNYRMQVLDCLIENKNIDKIKKEYRNIYNREIVNIKNKIKDKNIIAYDAKRVD